MWIADRFADVTTQATDQLRLDYETRLKSRQQLVLADGTVVQYQMPAGTCLRQDDLVLAMDGEARRVIRIEAAPEALIEVRADNDLHFARAAYHLGNRHVKVEIQKAPAGLLLRFQPDHVLEAMLKGLGCHLTPVLAPFQPEGGAYAGGHGHTHDHEHDHHHHDDNHCATGGPKIHSFS